MNFFWRISNNLYRGGYSKLARIFELLSFKLGDNAISAQCTIGEGTIFMHRGLGCVAHENTVIGSYCRICQNVTFGAKWSVLKSDDGKAPVVGNYVEIGAGAVILGGIHIGDHAVIGANAVVIHDVPPSTVVVGVPAKEIGLVEGSCWKKDIAAH